MNTRTDVCILGAGFAGLTLARQLHRRRPDLAVTLIEHRPHPVPEAAYKVGESTVEIASHYLSQTLGLNDHLDQAQLPKFGIRLFFRGDEPIVTDLACYDEVGPSRVLPIPTFQLDRGRFENYLATSCRANGAVLLDGTTVRHIALEPRRHQITVRDHAGERVIEARYLIDASGRRSWLRNQCQIAKEVSHGNHAVWFRVEGDVDIDVRGAGADWQDRCEHSPRRLSTNHFTGPGYWVWLIPLASGATSVGVVFDPKYVSIDDIGSHDKLMKWLAEEHPIVADTLRDRKVLDFHVMQNYALGARQTLCADGWMLTGDAGPFADPFYSPGGDFIAFANGYITELIATDASGDRYKEFERHFLAFFTNTISIYRGMYGCMGNRDLMVIKTIWDFTYYWAVLAKVFFTNRYVDKAFMHAAQSTLLRAAALNSGLQRALRRASLFDARVGGSGRFFDYYAVPLFHTLKIGLLRGDSPTALAELQYCVERAEQVASSLKHLLAGLESGKPLPDLAELGRQAAFAA